jgi:hypothetical protein
VVVFSFSKGAGNDGRLWNERLSKDFADVIPSYTVILLESVPKLFRGMATSGMKRNMPLSLQERTLVLYQDEELWKQRLAVSDESRAYIVLLRPDGRIHWINPGTFTDSEYGRLKIEIEKLLRN